MKTTKNRLWPVCYGLILTAFTAYVLLDAFVIPRSYASVAPKDDAGQSEAVVSSETQEQTATAPQATVTEDSYDDGSTKIEIKQYRENDTDIYVAFVTLSDASALKTAFAQSTYGKNVTQPASEIAAENNAILAINGDYYGTRSGYVIRNGELYRDASAGSDQQDLVIGADGSFSIVAEGETDAQTLLEGGAQQVLSFGPALLEEGEIAVGANAEVDKARTSNPRTAIGMVGKLQYVMVVADGRTSRSAGLSLYELATFMQALGVQTAYNLDGGGSSTMVFNGTVINQPTSNGKTIAERSVSDIVYIG